MSPCPAPNYYYQAFAINVSVSALHTIFSISNMDTFGLLYNNTFNPGNHQQNLISFNDDDGGFNQFSLAALLSPAMRYILVATTFSPDVFGPLQITISGPGTVTVI